jgi:hypothetical protein
MKDDERLPHALNFLVANNNLIRIVTLRRGAPRIERKQHCPEQQKMYERILEQSQHHDNLPCAATAVHRIRLNALFLLQSFPYNSEPFFILSMIAGLLLTSLLLPWRRSL